MSLSQLLEALRHDGAHVAETSAPGRYSITWYGGRPLQPPVQLVVNEQELKDYLANTAKSAQSVYPDHDAAAASFMVLLSLLDELITSKATPGTSIVISPRRVSVLGGKRAPITGQGARPEELEWRSSPAEGGR